MATRKFSFVPGEYFHIYNRGNSKQKIYLDQSDYQRFITLLFVSNSSNQFKLHSIDDPYKNFERGGQLVDIGAYCLMPNHFHLLLTPKTEEGVSVFMRKLSTGYSMYFNNKYKRSGGLFEGKFKAQIVSGDIYLKYLYSYIHLNPVKLIQPDWKENGISDELKARDYIKSYKYSSFMDYAQGGREEEIILEKKSFPEYFSSRQDFIQNTFDWFRGWEE